MRFHVSAVSSRSFSPLPCLHLLLALAGGLGTAQAAMNYDQPGSVYTQDFNWTTGDATLGTWTNDSVTQAIASWAPGASSLGWYIDIGGPRSAFFSRDGLTNASAAMNFFTQATDLDRSFGSSANNYAVSIAIQFRNTSGVTLTDFVFSYAIETTAVRGGQLGHVAEVSYHTGTPTNWATDSFLRPAAQTMYQYDIPLADGAEFITEITAVDGNDQRYRRERLDLPVTGLNWAPGEDLWLRWQVNQSDRGLNFGLDDFSFRATAIPEPANAGLWFALAAAGAIFRSTRRRLRA